MRRIIIQLLIMSTIFILFGCGEAVIKRTISDFEDSINDDNYSNFKETLSPQSDYYLTDIDIQNFFDHFVAEPNKYAPVHYSHLDISIDGPDADVYSDGSYEGGLTPINILFWMKREPGFFSFLSPDWRIFRYYEDSNDDGQFEETPYWRKP